MICRLLIKNIMIFLLQFITGCKWLTSLQVGRFESREKHNRENIKEIKEMFVGKVTV